jgi:hypothetical protein
MFDELVALLATIGLPTQDDKCVPPAQIMKWLGLWFYSNFDNKGSMMILMDKIKLDQVKGLLRSAIRSSSISAKQLQRLIGKIVHLSQTIYGAKSYYKYLISVLYSTRKGSKLQGGNLGFFKKAARFWLSEAEDFDGTYYVAEKQHLSGEWISTDACKEPAHGEPSKVGIGYFIQGEYVSICANSVDSFTDLLRSHANDLQRANFDNAPFNKNSNRSHTIAYIELYCIWWMISTDPLRFQDLIVPIHIDNTNNLAWIAKETAPIPYLPILRPLFTILRTYRIRLYPIWIASKANVLSDLASRGEIEKLTELLPSWKENITTDYKIPRPAHTIPGPLFMFKYGYVDGREVDETWSTPTADTMDEPYASIDP